MTKLKILIQGYAKKEKAGWYASPSTVLLRDSGLNILVDPGSNKKMLLKALTKENIRPNDIDLIFVTHYHLDHTLNIRLFPNCDVLDSTEINHNDQIRSYSQKIPKTNIRVIQTPGHAHEHASLLVKTEMGKVAIAGDLFWWTTTEKQKTDYYSLLKKRDPYVKDKRQAEQSRKKILQLADYVIPGHGKMFKVIKK
jgi:glyoxylase-like metal-dependent hydrolase (beta-lactamase superfamily II)